MKTKILFFLFSFFIQMVAVTTIFGQQKNDHYYSLLYQKSMIPKPDSVKIFDSYIYPYESITYDLSSYRNFTLGASYANLFPKHTFGLEISLPYQGQSYNSFSQRASMVQSSLKYISNNYINKNYKVYRIQALWKYILRVTDNPYYFYAYKNAPTPNDSVPAIEGNKQERMYLRGGLSYQVSPTLTTLTFEESTTNPLTEKNNGSLLHKTRAFAFVVGFEKQKEHYSATSIDRIRFYDYRKMKVFYADFLFQPFMGLGKLEYLDSIVVVSNDPSIVASSKSMDDASRDFIKNNAVKVNSIGLRVGYGISHVFNTPLGINFESGIMTGVSRTGSKLGSFYSKIILKVDINLTKQPLRTEGIAW